MKKIFALFVVVIMALSLCAVPVFAADPDDLITNGDFEAGNIGFTSEYRYVSETGHNTLQDPFVYAIGADPYLYHSAWSSFPAQSVSNMMIVNGATSTSDPAKLVWGQDVTLPVCDPVSTYPLYAGQTMLVGDVLVESDGDQICVKFVLNAGAITTGWLITEAHVAIANDGTGIPQTKKGNPIPGKFPVNEKTDPGDTEAGWYCLDIGEGWTAPFAVAAHAKIELPELGHWDTESEPDVWVVDRPYDEETAWGGEEDFPGKNWATYIDYTPVVCSTLYDFTMWAASSYHTNPAQLQVSINDEILDVLLLTSTSGGWVTETYTWDAGTATSATIAIRDLRVAYDGDDFVIDDISFVKQP